MQKKMSILKTNYLVLDHHFRICRLLLLFNKELKIETNVIPHNEYILSIALVEYFEKEVGTHPPRAVILNPGSAEHKGSLAILQGFCRV